MKTTLNSAILFFGLLCASWTQSANAELYAVLPLQGWEWAKPRHVKQIKQKFYAELRRQRVKLVPAEKVATAMKAVGAKDTKSCDTQCLLNIGRRVGATRVLAPDLFLQPKKQSVGVVWIWQTRQVNVTKGKEWGTFTRMCMCHRDTWKRVAKTQVERMLNYDPAKELRLPPGTLKAKPTKGPRHEPGMVFVPAGPFIMGSVLGEFDEEPRHIVELDAFYIDTYEVTNAQYSKCVTAGTCRAARFHWRKDVNQPNHPVVAVGWDDAVKYCKWAGKTLPTEAQWEKAARGTDERVYPWGNTYRWQWANSHWDKDGFKTTAPVGSFKQNVSPYGAYDMAGNAWEWTSDFWGPRYYKRSPRKNPTGPKTGVQHVMKGGSWMYDVPFFMSTHNRSPGRPWVRKHYVGFRCAKRL